MGRLCFLFRPRAFSGRLGLSPARALPGLYSGPLCLDVLIPKAVRVGEAGAGDLTPGKGGASALLSGGQASSTFHTRFCQILGWTQKQAGVWIHILAPQMP